MLPQRARTVGFRAFCSLLKNRYQGLPPPTSDVWPPKSSREFGTAEESSSWKGRAGGTPDEVAATFAELLGRPVRMDAVPRETWEPLFRSEGMKNPTPRIRMLDGFNEGWIEFENGEASSRKGEVALKTVLQMLIEREDKRPHVEGDCLAGAVTGLNRF
jgi:hypothetical protein